MSLPGRGEDRTVRVLLLVVLFLAGFGARLATAQFLDVLDRYSFDADGYLLLDGDAGDQYEYEGRGWHFASGGDFWSVKGDGNGPAGYPFVIGILYSIFGRSLFVLLVTNAVFGGLSALLTFWLARNLLPERWALLAGLAVALDPQLLYWSTRITTEALSVLLGAAIAAVTIHASRETTSRRWAVLAGVVLGLAVLVRNNFVVFVVALVMWWPIAVGRSREQWLKLGLALAGLVAVVLPCQMLTERLRPPEVAGQAQQFLSAEVLGPARYEFVARDKFRRQKGAPPTEEELARVTEEAWQYVDETPAWRVMARIWSFKFATLWRVTPTFASGTKAVVYTLRNVVLFALAVAGALMLIGRGRESRIAFYFVLSTAGLTALHCLVIARPRYRTLIDPYLWTLAAYCLFRGRMLLEPWFARLRAPTP